MGVKVKELDLINWQFKEGELPIKLIVQEVNLENLVKYLKEDYLVHDDFDEEYITFLVSHLLLPLFRGVRDGVAPVEGEKAYTKNDLEKAFQDGRESLNTRSEIEEMLEPEEYVYYEEYLKTIEE